MRILHVNKFLYRRGGAEGYMLDVARLQSERGHDVEFMAMSHPDNLDATYAEHFSRRIELDPPPDGLADRLKVSANVLWSRPAQRAMETVVARFRPDVVHLHNVYHQLSPSILRPLAKHGVPSVMTLHDYKLVCPTYQMLDHGNICEACLGGHFHRAVLRRCNHGSRIASALMAVELAVHTWTKAYGPIDVFVCPSEFLLSKMREGDVFPDRLRHLPHFADLGAFAPAQAPGHGVVVAGRLSHEKGIDVAIRALTFAPGIDLTIAGDGPERDALERLAAEVAPDRVRFTGRLATAELHELMRAASAVAVPSRWYENQPMIVLEALACARPVIASDLGGLPELIEDGVDGFLVAPDDPAALGAAMARLDDDRDRAHEMGKRGRARALEGFAIDAHIAGLDRIYAHAASRHTETR